MTKTPNFGLTQPDKGAIDWNIPLNENFSKIDSALTVTVPTESDLENIDANAGQPAFVTETQRFYIGKSDGSWSFKGDIVPASSDESMSTVSDGSFVPSPGNVQDAMDSARQNGGGIVKLNPRNDYTQPSTPWEVWGSVVLDFNGAVVRGTGELNNTNFIHIHPGGQVKGAKIDLHDGGNGYTSSNNYTGRVFSFDRGKYFARGTVLENAFINADESGGTACYLGLPSEGSYLTHFDINFDIGKPNSSNADWTMDTALHMDTTGGHDDGWINGMFITGHWRYVRTGILQEGSSGKYNQQVFNIFNIQIQPGQNPNAAWQILDPTWARANVVWGVIWDVHRYSEAGEYAWKIDSRYQDPDQSWRGCKRNAINVPDLPTDYVRNRSPNNHYVNHTDRFNSNVV